MGKDNKSSSVSSRAKTQYETKLEKEGYSIIKSDRFADIVASKDNKRYYFEIKATTKTSGYFGASTLTEMACAVKHKDNYTFVIAQEREHNTFEFVEWTLMEILSVSSIPPFKINFNIKSIHDRREGSGLKVQIKDIEKMEEFYTGSLDKGGLGKGLKRPEDDKQ